MKILRYKGYTYKLAAANIVHLDPRLFLRLAGSTDVRLDSESIKDYKRKIENEEDSLWPLWLELEKIPPEPGGNERVAVQTHDGRHRARAAIEVHRDCVPVELVDIDGDASWIPALISKINGGGAEILTQVYDDEEIAEKGYDEDDFITVRSCRE